MSAFLNTLVQASSSGAGGLALPTGIFIIAIIIGIALIAFWLWMLIDLLQSSKSTNEKILWAVLMIFIGFVASIIYFFIARNPSGRMSA